MEYLIGLFLSLAVAGLAIIGLDQERAFYPTVLIVIASYYVLFAVMAASGRTLVIEIAVASDFFAACHNGLQEKSLVSSHRPCWAPFDVDSRRFIRRALVEEQAGNSLTSATMLSRHSQLALNPVALEKLFSAEFSKRDCARKPTIDLVDSVQHPLPIAFIMRSKTIGVGIAIGRDPLPRPGRALVSASGSYLG